MNEPKFNIGDEVICVKNSGGVAGEGEVIARLYHMRGELINGYRVIESMWVYEVYPDPIPEQPTGWGEGNLRPIPKGNGKTLTEFMSEIKNTEHKEPVTA